MFRMKKQYNAPKAEKVEFNYEENVLASSFTTQSQVKCANPCGGSGHGNHWPPVHSTKAWLWGWFCR